MRVAVQFCLIGFERGPVDKSGMMVADQNEPLVHRQMTHALADRTVLIDITLTPGLAISISAGIDRISKYIVNRCVSRRNPPDLTVGPVLVRERQPFGLKPQPHAARRAKFGKTVEDGANRAGDRLVGMHPHLAICFTPNEADRQTATQFSRVRPC